MTWFPMLKRYSIAVAFTAVALLTACQREPKQAESIAWLVGGGDCALQARLTKAPEKLTPTPIVLTPRAGCPALSSATVNIDMTNMKMNVAPVELQKSGAGILPEWHGELVFTMGGPWRIEVKATDTDGAIRKGIKDVDVP